eukprot:g12450.t1
MKKLIEELPEGDDAVAWLRLAWSSLACGNKEIEPFLRQVKVIELLPMLSPCDLRPLQQLAWHCRQHPGDTGSGDTGGETEGWLQEVGLTVHRFDTAQLRGLDDQQQLARLASAVAPSCIEAQQWLDERGWWSRATSVEDDAEAKRPIHGLSLAGGDQAGGTHGARGTTHLPTATRQEHQDPPARRARRRNSKSGVKQVERPQRQEMQQQEETKARSRPSSAISRSVPVNPVLQLTDARAPPRQPSSDALMDMPAIQDVPALPLRRSQTSQSWTKGPASLEAFSQSLPVRPMSGKSVPRPSRPH